MVTYYVLIVSLIGSACMASWLADQKGRSITVWFWWGLLFGPLAILTLIGAPSKKVQPPELLPH